MAEQPDIAHKKIPEERKKEPICHPLSQSPTILQLSLMEQSDSRAEVTPVLDLGNQPRPVRRNHVRAGLRAQTVQVRL